MNGMLFVIPEPGIQVLNPDNQMVPLKIDGEYVPDNSYWRRRITQGDVSPGKEPTEPAIESPKPIQEPEIKLKSKENNK